MNAQKKHTSAANVGQYIQTYCCSIKNKGLVKFHHDITFGHNEVTMLMADTDMYQFYIEHKMPVVCTDFSGRILDDGIYINQVLEAKYPESTTLFKMLRHAAQKFELNYGRCSLHFSQREKDCQHLYSLFFDLSTEDFLHFIVNNGQLVHDLIDEYNFLSKDIIMEATSPENRVTLPNFKDFCFYQGHQASPNKQTLCVIHKITQLPMHLSPQRGQCLLHLLSGKSNKEISRAMQLSPKTIEHYLDILRKELGCRNSKELILSYAGQLV